MISLVLLTLALIALGWLIARNNRTPENLGVQDGRLLPLPDSPNAVSSQTEKADRRVPPLPFIGNRHDSAQAVLQAIEKYPGQTEIIRQTDSYLHCVFTTDRMKFKDDVEFFLDAENRLVHFRSASRLGYADMGVNRRRYEQLAALYLQNSSTP